MNSPDPFDSRFNTEASFKDLRTYKIASNGGLRKRLRLLILDDESRFLAALKDYLEAKGFLVHTASDGTNALTRIKAIEYDIVLCDIQVPELSGDMFYLAVESFKPNLCKRFIFMTGHERDPGIKKFIHTIRGQVLWKPFRFRELVEMIQEITRKYDETI